MLDIKYPEAQGKTLDAMQLPVGTIIMGHVQPNGPRTTLFRAYDGIIDLGSPQNTWTRPGKFEVYGASVVKATLVLEEG